MQRFTLGESLSADVDEHGEHVFLRFAAAEGSDVELSIPYQHLVLAIQRLLTVTDKASDRQVATLGKAPSAPRAPPAMVAERVDAFTKPDSRDVLLQIVGRSSPSDPPGLGSALLPDGMLDRLIVSLKQTAMELARRDTSAATHAEVAEPELAETQQQLAPAEQRRVVRSARRSQTSAREFVLMLGKHGNHYYPRWHFMTDQDADAFFRGGAGALADIIRDARDFAFTVPHIQNLIGSTWEAQGVSVEAVRGDATQGRQVISGDGQYTLQLYWHTFEEAAEALGRLSNTGAVTHLRTAIERSVDSIDHYLIHRAELWNESHPLDKLTDDIDSRVSTKEKVKRWIPHMLNGRKLSLGRSWNRFLALRDIRDEAVVHPKSTLMGATLIDMARMANDVRDGPAKLMVELHLLFDEPIPAVILKEAYGPDWRVQSA